MLKFGDESRESGDICGDCGVKKGQIHHWGCGSKR